MFAKMREKEKEDMYKVYITDSLRAAYNLNMRYFDIITPSAPIREEDAQEIINRITAKIEGLK